MKTAVWSKEGGFSLFSHIPANRIYKWNAGEGVSGYVERSGSCGAATVADRYGGWTINGSNDLVFKSNGDLHLTDPPFGPSGSFEDREKAAVRGLYRVEPVNLCSTWPGARTLRPCSSPEAEVSIE